MTYKEFLEVLEEVELDLDSAAEALDLEISDTFNLTFKIGRCENTSLKK